MIRARKFDCQNQGLLEVLAAAVCDEVNSGMNEAVLR